MRILITTFGSTGDIYPMLALAHEFNSQGHTVRCASTPLFRDDVARAQAEWVDIPPHWDSEKYKQASCELCAQKSALRQLRYIYKRASEDYQECLDILEQELPECDLFIGSYIFPSFRKIAEKHNVPFAVIAFCNNTVPSVDFPPDVVPNLNWLPKALSRNWNRLWWNLANYGIDNSLNRFLLKKSGVKLQKPFKNFCYDPAEKVIVAVSPSLFYPKEAAINKRFVYSGYLRFQAKEDEEIERECKAFCEGKKVPILNFGSITFKFASNALEYFLKLWPQEKKLIVQTGWAEFQPKGDRPNVLTVGKVSHDQLFKHASVVFHHGGAGTTASALHAGCPQLIMPKVGDQPYWAKQVMRLGVGLRVSPDFWPKHAPAMIQRLELREKYRRNAERYATQLAQENGPQRAVEELLQLAAAGAA